MTDKPVADLPRFGKPTLRGVYERYSRVMSYYDDYWQKLSGAKREDVTRLWWRPAYDRIASSIEPQMNVLVAGCGPGDDLEFVAARGANPIGIDISAQALLMARSRGSKVILANLESLPFRPGVFEVILIMNVIMFTNAAQSLEEAKRIGKAGSSIVLMEPLANAFLISLARRFQPYRKMVTQYWNPEIRLQSSGSWRCLSEDRFFLFSSLWAGIWYERPFPLWARKVLDFISEMDAFLLRVFPWTRRFAYLAVTIFKADA